jgi:hypothetical protein
MISRVGLEESLCGKHEWFTSMVIDTGCPIVRWGRTCPRGIKPGFCRTSAGFSYRQIELFPYYPLSHPGKSMFEYTKIRHGNQSLFGFQEYLSKPVSAQAVLPAIQTPGIITRLGFSRPGNFRAIFIRFDPVVCLTFYKDKRHEQNHEEGAAFRVWLARRTATG